MEKIKQKRMIGFSLGLFLIIAEVSVYLLSMGMTTLGLQNYFSKDILTYVCNALAIYVLGFGFLKLFLRKTEKYEADQKFNLKFGKLLYLIMITIGLGIVASFATNIIMIIIRLIFHIQIGNRVTDMILKFNPILNIIFAGILGPIFEELIFRGLFLSRLRVFGDKTAMIYTSILFGLFHTNFAQIPMAICIGLVLSYAMIKTNKIIYPIIIHMSMNLITCILSSMITNGMIGFVILLALLEFGCALATIISLPIVLTSRKHKLDVSNESKYDRKKLYFNVGYIFSVIVVILITIYAIIGI